MRHDIQKIKYDRKKKVKWSELLGNVERLINILKLVIPFTGLMILTVYCMNHGINISDFSWQDSLILMLIAITTGGFFIMFAFMLIMPAIVYKIQRQIKADGIKNGTYLKREKQKKVWGSWTEKKTQERK